VNLLSASGVSPIGPIRDLDGANVLILGYGSIGRAVEARLVPFGVNITRVAAHRREGVHTVDALPELLPKADLVVVLLPMSDTTNKFVDRAFLAKMRDGAIFVNAGRGGVVDTDALLAELETQRLHAALDVTDPEPLPADHPLWHAPNLLMTPHIAGSTTRWLERAYALAGDQIRRFAGGEPLANVRSDVR
jgi:phosphoglycerate dehydrogenase-like enzyme